eukprot:5987292-Alexandrium_andersonii.AAC.1
MFVGALALVMLGAGRSEVLSVTAALFRGLPPVESFRRACAEYPLRNGQDLLGVLALQDAYDADNPRAFPLEGDAYALNQLGLIT